jgi:hypothetical protein
MQTLSHRVYCAVVLDAYSRRVVGWSIDSSPNAALVTNALGMAIDTRKPPGGTLIHSDHGTQFTSWAFTHDLVLQGCAFGEAAGDPGEGGFQFGPAGAVDLGAEEGDRVVVGPQVTARCGVAAMQCRLGLTQAGQDIGQEGVPVANSENPTDIALTCGYSRSTGGC